MINFEELKLRGLNAFKSNYTRCVLASLVLSAATGAGVTVSQRFGSGIDTVGGSAGLTETLHDVFSDGRAFVVTAVIALAVLVMWLVAIAVDVFLKNPLEVGGKRFFLHNALNPATDVEEMVYAFKNNYLNNAVVMFMHDLVIGLWTLLLVIPGIIKSYELFMVPYLLAENPDINWKDAQTISKNMMEGHKMDAFLLRLSFIGWYLLSMITCGIVHVLYTGPYVQATMAEFCYQVERDYRTRISY